MKFSMRLAAAASLCLGLAGPALAAPFTPADDSVVVEKLPGGASDPAVRRVDSLRKQLAARPGDGALRLEIARRYFELAMAQGDPRFVGYASATIAPLLATADNNAGYWLLRGLIEQYSHDFGAALASLDRASKIDPANPEPMAWRSAIDMVQARYPQALAECKALAPLTPPLYATGCMAYVQSATGQLLASWQQLQGALAAAPNADPGLRVWALTRLADMAQRLQKPDEAETHFRAALALGINDQYLLGAYSDFLLEHGRPAEVEKLLADWERSDVLLLRLALAGAALKDSHAAGWAGQMRDRFQAAAQRGDRLHEQEAARFELDVEKQPKEALALAVRNYAVQKEPRDAEVLMRTALAAGDAKAAQPALDWLRSSRYEDPRLAQLAAQLVAQGARR
ncbi:tetratricopeptide repeat protein [Caenimonas terrae]|uniref:Tetratricopeptide repeat protein n=1 Tax=Caenimonas terrae TaxID=696074 RepID=A0ABW0NLF5_9BURK